MPAALPYATFTNLRPRHASAQLNCGDLGMAKKPKTSNRKDRGTGGLRKPVQPSPELGAIVGDEPLARSEVVSKIWAYIRENNLQNPANKREILADDKLEKVFGRDKVTMFEMNKHLERNIVKGGAHGSGGGRDD